MTRRLIRASVFTVAGAVAAGCGTDDPGTAANASSGSSHWGPLALVDIEGTGGGEALIGDGVLRVGDRCVVLDTADSEIVLVWRADQTTWDAERRSITFRRPAGTSVELHDGDHVVATGGGLGPEGAAPPDFLVAPDESCPSEQAVVTDVTPPD